MAKHPDRLGVSSSDEEQQFQIDKRVDDEFRSLIDQVGDAILIVDDHARYINANKNAELLTGYTREELLRMTIADLTPGASREMVQPVFEEFKRAGNMSGEYEILRKDGTTVSIEYNASRLGSGRYLSIMRDVTDRKKLQEALQQSERRYRTLVETSNDLIWSVNRDGRFTFVNQAFHEILGYEPFELLGKHFVDLLQEAEKKKQLRLLHQILRKADAIVADLKFYVHSLLARFDKNIAGCSIRKSMFERIRDNFI